MNGSILTLGVLGALEIASRIKKGSLNSETELLGHVDGSPIYYRVITSDHNRYLLIVIYYNQQAIGRLKLRVSKNLFQKNIHRWGPISLPCRKDIIQLTETYPQVARYDEEGAFGGYKLAFVATVNTLYNVKKRFEEWKGRGLGKAMYILAMREWFKAHGPFLFMPNYCEQGSTSDQAMRVWKSLSRDFPSSGDVIVVLTLPPMPLQQ